MRRQTSLTNAEKRGQYPLLLLAMGGSVTPWSQFAGCWWQWWFTASLLKSPLPKSPDQPRTCPNTHGHDQASPSWLWEQHWEWGCAPHTHIVPSQSPQCPAPAPSQCQLCPTSCLSQCQPYAISFPSHVSITQYQPYLSARSVLGLPIPHI